MSNGSSMTHLKLNFGLFSPYGIYKFCSLAEYVVGNRIGCWGGRRGGTMSNIYWISKCFGSKIWWVALMTEMVKSVLNPLYVVSSALVSELELQLSEKLQCFRNL